MLKSEYRFTATIWQQHIRLKPWSNFLMSLRVRRSIFTATYSIKEATSEENIPIEHLLESQKTNDIGN